MKNKIYISIIIISIFLDVFFLILIHELYQNSPTRTVISRPYSQIDAFNNQFISYEGDQTGSQVSALMGRLIANANTYKDEPCKNPSVNCDRINKEEDSPINIVATYNNNSDDLRDKYIKDLAKIKQSVESKYMYNISFEYDNSCIISQINISYERSSDEKRK